MAKHEETFVDFDQPYEQNIIGLRGVIYFGIGLFLLIVITFGLMWVFQFQVLQPQAEARDKINENPLAMKGDERLPPEPRLQAAPGFGVDDPKGGRINLELREPQAEYRELQKQWEDLWKNGQKQDGTVIALSIEEAKKKMLADTNTKAKNDESGKKSLEEARSLISASSAGRTRSDIRR